MNRRSALLPLLLLGATGVAGLFGAACGGKEAPMPDQTAQAAPATSAAPEAPAAAPAPGAPDPSVGPISSRSTTPDAGALSAPAAPSSVPAAGDAKLLFDLPKAWTAETPGSPMRIAQASIPGAAGAGELGVFYFGSGGGGKVEDNLERWTGQVEAGPGTPKPERGSLEANGLKVTWVEVHGTLKPSSMGMGPSSPIADARLLGAVVEGPGGPWFFKATGPDKTLGPQRDAFFAMLKSAHVAPNA